MGFGIINHNISSINTLRSLQKNNRKTVASLEKLSSGLRINRAADDAAGLSVSEKMRGQISGMSRAIKNIQDGISMIQTAEGALNTVHSTLQRMRNLSLQATNDSYTSRDRKKIQLEIDSLINELDKMSEFTEFNTKKLLNSDLIGKARLNSSIAKAEVNDQVINADYSINVLFPGKKCVRKTIKTLTDTDNNGKINMHDIGLDHQAEFHIFCGDHSEILFINPEDSLDDIVFKINTSHSGVHAGLLDSKNGISLSSIRIGSKYNISFGDDPDGIAEKLGLTSLGSLSSGIGASIEVSLISGVDRGKTLGIFKSDSRTFSEKDFSHPIVRGDNLEASGYLKGFKLILDDSDNINSYASNYMIPFSSNRDGNNEIYLMNSDGSNQIRLTNNPSDESSPYFSPDGSKIVFQSNRDGNNEIYLMNADGSNQIRLTNNAADDINPIFSPDGSKILFTSTRDGNAEFYIMDSDGKNLKRLTNNTYTDLAASFSPDGTKIAFSSNRGGNWDIYTMNIDGSNEQRLTTDVSVEWTPFYTPDGSKMAFVSNRSGGLEVYYMNVDGSDQQITTNAGGAKWIPVFSPDGSKIIYSSDSDGDWDVYSMNPDGSNQTNITDNIGIEDAVGLSGAGLSASPSGGSFILQIRDTRPKFHIASNQGQTISVDFPNISAQGLGLSSEYYAEGAYFNGHERMKNGTITKDYSLNISVQTRKSAESSISLIDSALERVSEARSKLGAFQNSLEKAMNYSEIASEHLTSSESRLKDADIAYEMSKFTKEQIIAQSATAMLAQTNSKSQYILNLLK